jgi:hypothetical protein
MAEPGFDLEEIRDGLATWLKTQIASPGFDIVAYPHGAVHLPALGIFPSSEYISYWGTFGNVNHSEIAFDLRGVAAYGAQDSARLLDRMLSTGVNQSISVVDPFRADPTCGGLVKSALPQVAFRRDYGDENSGLYEAVIRLAVVVKRRTV